MKRENQALSLANFMQSRGAASQTERYELSLPLVEVGRSRLKDLARDDIMLLGFYDLRCILVDGDFIYASMLLKERKKSMYLEIIDIEKKSINRCEGKKYQSIKVSFGEFECRKLEVGHSMVITHKVLHNVSIIVEDNIYAEGSLVNVDGELAVKIDKVIKSETR